MTTGCITWAIRKLGEANVTGSSKPLELIKGFLPATRMHPARCNSPHETTKLIYCTMYITCWSNKKHIDKLIRHQHETTILSVCCNIFQPTGLQSNLNPGAATAACGERLQDCTCHNYLPLSTYPIEKQQKPIKTYSFSQSIINQSYQY